MEIIGFYFSKICAERSESFKGGKVNNQIKFSDFNEKSNFGLDESSSKLDFEFNLTYGVKSSDEKDNSGIFIQGSIILRLGKNELKEFKKSWKNKEIPKEYISGIYNLILRKCTLKALEFEEDVRLPLHLPIPQVSSQNIKTEED